MIRTVYKRDYVLNVLYCKPRNMFIVNIVIIWYQSLSNGKMCISIRLLDLFLCRKWSDKWGPSINLIYTVTILKYPRVEYKTVPDHSRYQLIVPTSIRPIFQLFRNVMLVFHSADTHTQTNTIQSEDHLKRFYLSYMCTR